MKKQSQIFAFLIALSFVISACGVKGKPLPPLKKGEAANQNKGPQTP